MMENAMTPADIAAVTRNSNQDGMGGAYGGWLWIIVLMLFWNRGGWGGYGNDGCNGQALTEAQYCTGMNFNQLENAVARAQDKMDRTQEGLANLGYENLKTQMGMQQAMQQCCCDTNANIAQLRSDMQKGFCDTNHLITTLSKDNEIAALKQQISAMQFNDLRADLTCQIERATANVVRYPSGYTYSAGNSPFCGCNPCAQNGNF